MATQVGVDPGYETLSGCFFISCRSVDLTGKEKVANGLCFESVGELGRVEIIVFDSISRPINANVFEGRDCL